jgi:hypothetical protein
MLLYRFDNVERFPILDSRTSARGMLTTRLESSGEAAVLGVAVRRDHADTAESVIVLGLPLRSVEGKLAQVQLELDDGGGDVRAWLEAADAAGVGLVYTFGAVSARGWQQREADASRPDERWMAGPQGDIAQPIQLQRLGLAVKSQKGLVIIKLRALSVTGDARIVPGGIA